MFSLKLREINQTQLNDNSKKTQYSIEEITDESEIPEAWKNAIIWGCDEEMTPVIFLSEQKTVFDQKEYEEFLRLKKKYQNE